MNDSDLGKRSWTILIVDDEPNIREFLRSALEQSIPGLRTIMAENGKVALERLEQDTVDLILSDQRMPVMDGIEFLGLAAKIAPDVPRILLTGFADVDMAVRAVNDGHINAFFQKPASVTTLSAAILRLLQIRQATTLRHQAFARSIDLVNKGISPNKAPPGDDRG
jgi:DNA-binding NtrC family response regulator